MLAALWAVSTRILGSSQMISILPIIETFFRPLIAFSSSISYPFAFSLSSSASARPQLIAWCSPGRGTFRCSNLLVDVVTQILLCGPCSLEDSNR